MKKIKLLSALLLVSTVTLSLFVGCGNKETTQTTNTEPDKSNKNVQITWWNFPNFTTVDGEVGKYEKQIIADFESKNPNIKVNLEMLSFNGGGEKLNAAIASNSAPDVLYDAPGRIIDYGRRGVLVPLNDMIEKLNGDVPDGILQGCRVDDTYYMYPFTTTTFCMAVNKTMFEEAGLLNLLPLDRPGRTWTIEEFETALREIKKAKPDVLPMIFYSKSTQGDQGTRAFVANLYGGAIISDDFKKYELDSPEMVKSMEWVKKAVDEGLIGAGGEALTSGNAIDTFVQQKAAFTILYSTDLKAKNAANKVGEFEDVLVSIPSPSQPKLEAFISGLCVFDNKDQDKIDASKKFIDFLCNDPAWQIKNIKSNGTFSVRKSITGLYTDAEMKSAEEMGKFTSPYYNTVPGFAEMRTYWFPTLQQITMGQSSAQDALKELNVKANETLNKK